MSLDSLLQRTDIWRGRDLCSNVAASVPTGFPELDAYLPGGGWPLGTLTELLVGRKGMGALHVVMPALTRLSHEGRWLVWVVPPHIPYAPALAQRGMNLKRMFLIRPPRRMDGLWALEQALRSGVCEAVLAWLEPEARVLRRLQLAAEAGNSWGLLFRSCAAAAQASSAALRLKVVPTPEGAAVTILKRPGGWGVGPVYLSHNQLPSLASPECRI